MPGPNASTTTALPDVRNVVYRQLAVKKLLDTFVADSVFPRRDTDLRAGTVKRIPREEYLNTPDDTRAPDGTYPRSDMSFDDFTFKTADRGHEQVVDESNREAYKIYFNAQAEAGEIALLNAKRAHEVRCARIAQTAGNNGANAGAHAVWSDMTGATPIEDVKIAREAVRSNCGMEPNTIVIPWKAWNNLILTGEIRDRLGVGGSASDPGNVKIANEATVAKVFDVDRIVIAKAVVNSADKGQPPVLADLWDKTKVWIGYVNPEPNDYSLAYGWNSHWTGDGSEYEFRMEEYWKDEARRWYIRVRRHVEPKVLESVCGYLLTGVLAP
jgi:hypothetical protein